MYDNIDKLTALWRVMEERYANLTLSTNNPLELSRLGAAKVRLCYNGTPLLECSAKAKVEAVQYVPAFLKDYEEAKQLLTIKSAEAVEQLCRYLNITLPVQTTP